MNLFRENKLFTIAWFGFILSCLIIVFSGKQGDGIRFFSENRSFFGDGIFAYGTKMGEEIAYLVLVVLMLFVGYGKALMVGLTGLIVTICSYPLKMYFSHPRPKLFFKKLGELDQLNLVEGVELHSQYTSFPSGHTMSAFALYGLMSFIFRKHWKWQLVFFACALIVATSRVYLVQHFVKDVLLGAVIGYLIAFLMYKLLEVLERKKVFLKNLASIIKK